METLSASPYPVTPQTQISHLRSSQFSSGDPAIAATGPAQATRSMQEAELQQHPQLSAPASQESIASVQSTQSSTGPWLQNSSSNVSQLTSYTDLTSPVANSYEQYAASKSNVSRVRTPEESSLSVQTYGNHAAASPMNVTSPVTTNGTKRTASGHVKNAPSLPNTPMTSTFTGRRPRTDSISSTGSRAGDLAMTLKTRLGYAMAKVQHGLEHKNIHEVEHLATRRVSAHRHSMSHLDYSTRPISGGMGHSSRPVSMYEADTWTAYPPSKRQSGVYSTFASSSQPALGTEPRLQPAADIRPTVHPTHYATAPSSQTTTYNNIMSPPRTPINGQHRRPPTIRTELQTAEAERDALQALFQLGSPQGSQMPRHYDMSQASSSQASPLRSEFATPRRVTFAWSESDSSREQMSSDGSLPDAGTENAEEP